MANGDIPVMGLIPLLSDITLVSECSKGTLEHLEGLASLNAFTFALGTYTLKSLTAGSVALMSPGLTPH